MTDLNQQKAFAEALRVHIYSHRPIPPTEGDPFIEGPYLKCSCGWFASHSSSWEKVGAAYDEHLGASEERI
jgi:hypothetical protein